MSFIYDQIPYFHALLRSEYTKNLKAGFGDYLDVLAVGIRCQRGVSLQFQVWITDGEGAGGMFLVPIEALCTKECPQLPTAQLQPWDSFGSTFSVSRMDLFHRQRCYVLPKREPARYQFTIDFVGNDLSEDPEQHKMLHIVAFDSGHIGAFPNNRLLIHDPAFFDDVCKERPNFEALAKEFTGE